MALNDFQMTALLNECDKCEDDDENGFDNEDVENTFENLGNMESIDINDSPIEIADEYGEFIM